MRRCCSTAIFIRVADLTLLRAWLPLCGPAHKTPYRPHFGSPRADSQQIGLGRVRGLLDRLGCRPVWRHHHARSRRARRGAVRSGEGTHPRPFAVLSIALTTLGAA